MSAISISNLKLLKILDEGTQEIFHGCSQEWYPTEWQRFSGCGPSVASTILFYLLSSRSESVFEAGISSRNSCLPFMEEVWEYVTPTERGIPSAKMFCESVRAYVRSKGLKIDCGFIDVPEEKALRPALSEISGFIEKALLSDLPVGFLLLCNGKLQEVEAWHWVTIVSLEQPGSGAPVVVEILDKGQIKRIDLDLWLETTGLGGSFAYFSIRGKR
jgi:hypothetical protein